MGIIKVRSRTWHKPRTMSITGNTECVRMLVVLLFQSEELDAEREKVGNRVMGSCGYGFEIDGGNGTFERSECERTFESEGGRGYGWNKQWIGDVSEKFPTEKRAGLMGRRDYRFQNIKTENNETVMCHTSWSLTEAPNREELTATLARMTADGDHWYYRTAGSKMAQIFVNW